MPRPAEMLLGRIALERGLLTPPQLDAALHAQEEASPPPPLGVLLVERGHLTHARVEELLVAQASAFAALDPLSGETERAWHFGHLAVLHGLASAAQVNAALREQGRRADAGQPHMPLGKILIDQGAMTLLTVAEVLRLQGEGLPTLGPGTHLLAPTPAARAGDPPPGAPDTPASPAPPAPATSGGPATMAPQDAAPADPTRPSSTGGKTPAQLSAPYPGARRGTTSLVRRKFGKYDLVQELGRGGMGVVYKGYRADLKVYFAVKILLAGEDASGEAMERFQREAQASARLRHPGIVAVHDIGVEEDKPYYAMEYVEGVSLDKLMEDPDRAGLKPPEGPGPSGRRHGLVVRDAVRIALEVAEAIDHAHRQGVIHRDLKPGNVLLDRDGKARIVDFGLAKLLEPHGGAAGPRLTKTGVVIGTLSYMPPEQAAGDQGRIDARTDVYSLGAVLYEMVTGRLPLSAQTEIELLGKVLARDPERPRALNPDLPQDLETILMKAMEKEPGRRYASAGALAADLRRFLDGEAIAARPPSTAYRFRTWARRRRGLVAAGSVLAIAAAAAATFAWRAHRAEIEKADLTARMAAEGRERAALRHKILLDLREKAGLLVSATLILRRAGASMEKASVEFLPQLQRAVLEVEREDPGAAEPSYHLGRMYRALMRFDAALAAQGEALAREPDFAPSLYERTVLLARRLGDRVAALRHRWLREEGQRLAASGLLAKGGLGGDRLRGRPADPALIEADRDAKALQAEVVAALARLEAVAAGGAPPAVGADPARGVLLTPGRLDCARGLRLVNSSDRTEDRTRAPALLEQALRTEPALEEAYEGLAQLAAGEPTDLIALYTRALEADRGYYPFWIGRGDASAAKGLAGREAGEDPAPLYGAAEADYGQAIELAPASTEAWMRRGVVRTFWGAYKMSRRQDPGGLYGGAETDCSKALELDPSSATAWMSRGVARAGRGLYRTHLSQDPTDLFAAALDDYTRAQALDPQLAEAWRRRGQLLMEWGAWTTGAGADPGDVFGKAETDLGHALELDPVSAEAWLCRGSVRLNWGMWKARRDQDPTELFAKSEADLVKAVELAPRSASAWTCRGTLRKNWGAWQLRTGRDAAPLLSGALADFGQGIALNPGSAEPRWTRGALLYSLRRWREAVTDFEAALKINPATDVFFHDQLEECRRRLAADPAAPDWLRALAEGERAIQADDYVRAGRTYTDALMAFRASSAALPETERGRVTADPANRKALARAYYNLTCIAALSSAGKAGPKATPAAFTPEHAAAMRDHAFRYLDQALEFGWNDRAHTEADTDLAPLHDDPRWAATLARIK